MAEKEIEKDFEGKRQYTRFTGNGGEVELRGYFAIEDLMRIIETLKDPLHTCWYCGKWENQPHDDCDGQGS